jgi:polysaccharide biosynthesis transport protein
MQEEALSLQELIGAARRRILPVAAVSVCVLAVAVPIVFAWPAVYRSTATILIEEQEIPRELVRSTVTTMADERIQVISQQVMTRSMLMQIVQKYDLYPRERRYVSNEEILERMRRDVRTQTINVEGGERRPFSSGSRTIAFKVSYDNETPAKAQQVANELVTLYLNENLRTRRQRADEATLFFADEAARIGRQIGEIEGKLAAFKRANAGRLPEMNQLNMQLRDRSEMELDEIERQIRLLEDRRVYLESQLTVIKETAPIPNERVLDPDERLRSLRNQYASQSGIYAESHPDLTRMRREIAALETSTGKKAQVDPKAIEDARNELAGLTDRYGADHPDVIRQLKRVAALEAQQAKAPAKKPDNPAYVSLAAQIESSRAEGESLRSRREEVRSRVAAYNARLEQAPGVEQAYRDLVRDQDNALAKYKEIRAKQMESQVALELEKGRKGERFSLIDPPQYPEKPYQPDRKKLLATALAASLGGGIGAAALAESLDRSVKSARSLGALLQAPVLGVVPRIDDPARARRRRRRILIGLGVALALAVVAAAAVNFFVMPLESLWHVLLRRLQL